MRGRTLAIATVVGTCLCVSAAVAKPKPGTYKPGRVTAPTMGPVQDGGWSDNFDALVVGPIIGQAGWQGWAGTLPLPEGYVDNTQSASAPNSMRITNIGQANSSDCVQVYTVNGGKWKFTGKSRVPSTVTGRGFIILLNTYPAFDWSCQLEFNRDTNVAGLVPAIAGQAGVPVPLVVDAWVPFQIDIDLVAVPPTFGLSYNGVTIATGQQWSTLNNPDLQALDVYADTLVGHTMFFDDLKLEEVVVCYPDCNLVGGLTIADFGCFQTKFVAGDPYADCNGVGGLTIADFGCFQTKFVAGCP